MPVGRDVIAGLVLIGIGLWYGLEATSFRPGRAGDPGPGMFPLLLAGTLIALSAWLVIQSLATKRAEKTRENSGKAAGRILTAHGGLARTIAAVALTIGSIAAFQPLGYILTVGIYAGLMSLLFRRDSAIIPLITAAVAIGGIHLLFVEFLNVRMPAGVL